MRPQFYFLTLVADHSDAAVASERLESGTVQQDEGRTQQERTDLL
ncbi:MULTISPECIES: hypothetical protein [Cyanophyceae]|nr:MULTISPECIES: hypothetical protein [Cyanophyceae]